MQAGNNMELFHGNPGMTNSPYLSCTEWRSWYPSIGTLSPYNDDVEIFESKWGKNESICLTRPTLKLALPNSFVWPSQPAEPAQPPPATPPPTPVKEPPLCQACKVASLKIGKLGVATWPYDHLLYVCQLCWDDQECWDSQKEIPHVQSCCKILHCFQMIILDMVLKLDTWKYI